LALFLGHLLSVAFPAPNRGKKVTSVALSHSHIFIPYGYEERSLGLNLTPT